MTFLEPSSRSQFLVEHGRGRRIRPGEAPEVGIRFQKISCVLPATDVAERQANQLGFEGLAEEVSLD